MQVIEHPYALPGCCFKCRTGSENRKWFVDLEFSMDDFGAIIICDACIEEMAHNAGYLTPEEVVKLKAESQRNKEALEAALITIEGLEQAVDGLRLAGSSGRTYSEFHDPVVTEPEQQDAPERVSVLDSGTGEDDEPLHDEGMVVVHSNESSNVGIFKLDL